MSNLLTSDKITKKNALDNLHNTLVFSSKDMSASRYDAWLYGIIVGWDAKSQEELSVKFKWDTDAMKDLNKSYKKMRKKEAKKNRKKEKNKFNKKILPSLIASGTVHRDNIDEYSKKNNWSNKTIIRAYRLFDFADMTNDVSKIDKGGIADLVCDSGTLRLKINPPPHK